jgi:hypothetical protein
VSVLQELFISLLKTIFLLANHRLSFQRIICCHIIDNNGLLILKLDEVL